MKESLIECYDVAGMFCSMRCLVSLRFHGLSIIGLMTWFDDTKAQIRMKGEFRVPFCFIERLFTKGGNATFAPKIKQVRQLAIGQQARTT